MRFAVGVVLALAIATPCAAAGVQVDVPPPAVVPALEAGAVVAPVSFTRMAANLAEGQIFAEVRGGWGCIAQWDLLRWKSELNQFGDPDFERILREEFSKASLKVSGDQTNLFEQDRKNSDLQLGALVTDIKAKMCSNTLNLLYNSGSSTMGIQWQVYSTSAGKVIARISTHGGVKDFKGGDLKAMLVSLVQLSFAENVRQLAASSEFRRIVLDPAASAAPAAATSRTPLQASLLRPAKPVALKDATSGAVVIFAGAGSGSGVLISPDGYILTNHHVTGDSGKVRVRWADGTDTVGEVVRADRHRDVALIKVAAPRGRPLAIRRTPVELGETVFAIGTPLDPSLQNTVTKGVVSAVRMVEGQPFIQSDTPVTHGNSGGPLLDEAGAIVGLTDLGLDPAAGSTINFFIPISDALKVLAVQPAA